MPRKKGDMKYVEKNNVFFVGLNKLGPSYQQKIKDVIYNEYVTLERELKKINSLKLTFKEYEKGGKSKFSVKLLIDAETKPITVEHMPQKAEWNPVDCVHEVIRKARNQIIHKFKTDSNFRKPYEKGTL
jgi:hypothetical protein